MDEKKMKERIELLEATIRKGATVMVDISKALHPSANRMVGLTNIARKSSDQLAIEAEAMRDAL